MAGIRKTARPCFLRFSSLAWVPPNGVAVTGLASQPESEGIANGRRAVEQTAPNAKARPSSSRNIYLSKETELLVDTWQPCEELIKQRDQFLWELRTYLASEIPGSTVVPFGSTVTGLWLAHSDLDISIEVPGVRERSSSLRVLKRAAAAIHRLTTDRPEARFTATVPILRWTPSSKRAGSVVCDISVNNSLAVANSRLLAQYIATDMNVRKLAIFLKVWARLRGINDRSQGTLSSFALTLMLIHFLQRRQVLPCLQSLAALRNEPPHSILGLDCRFCADPMAIAAAVSEIQEGAGSGVNDHAACTSDSGRLGALLIGFFRYFHNEYSGSVISVNAGWSCLPDTSPSDSSLDGKPFFVVENPFEQGRDVANLEVGQILRVRQELRRAHRMLHRGRSLTEVCADVRLVIEDFQKT